MKWKKYIIPAIGILLVLVLFSLYMRQRRLYRQTLQINRSLVQDLKQLQQKEANVSQALEQISGSQSRQEFSQSSFMDRKKYFRVNWKNYIHVSLNDYKTGFLGGLHGVKVQVVNDTEYPLDNVAVRLEYRRSNGDVFKTETVTINNIPPKHTGTAPAPDSRKGMSLEMSLQQITSQQMNFCWSPGKKASPGNNDPYQCVASQ